MPLCLPGEMTGKQKTVLIVNLHLVTKETDFSLWKPLLSANVFGALADNGFAGVTSDVVYLTAFLRTKILHVLSQKV